jgi:DNA-directed RNA polymerase specialized sigma24 family protein
MNAPSAATAAAAFSESDFERLAAAIDRVGPQQRELFLTKLVILLTAGAPAGTLEERINRAMKNLGAKPDSPDQTWP